jgi:hypothetical protein
MMRSIKGCVLCEAEKQERNSMDRGGFSAALHCIRIPADVDTVFS